MFSFVQHLKGGFLLQYVGEKSQFRKQNIGRGGPMKARLFFINTTEKSSG